MHVPPYQSRLDDDNGCMFLIRLVFSEVVGLKGTHYLRFWCILVAFSSRKITPPLLKNKPVPDPPVIETQYMGHLR